MVYQLGPATLHTRALASLLGSLLAVPVFETLRTKEQLGYLVSAAACTTGHGGVAALRISVQSSRASCQHIEERISACMAAFRGVLEGLGEGGVAAKAAVLAARVRELATP